jgi:hypothetical protein
VDARAGHIGLFVSPSSFSFIIFAPSTWAYSFSCGDGRTWDLRRSDATFLGTKLLFTWASDRARRRASRALQDEAGRVVGAGFNGIVHERRRCVDNWVDFF